MTSVPSPSIDLAAGDEGGFGGVVSEALAPPSLPATPPRQRRPPTEVITLTDSPFRPSRDSDGETDDVSFLDSSSTSSCPPPPKTRKLVSEWMAAVDLSTRIEIGDLVEFRRTIQIAGASRRIYTHWAMYIGRLGGAHRLVHASMDDGDFDGTVSKIAKGNAAEIRADPLLVIAGVDLCRINNELDAAHAPLPPRVAVFRAQLQLGTKNYHILFNNCEHFVKWCRYGRHHSGQAAVVQAALIGSTTLALTGSLSLTAGAVIAYSAASLYGKQIVSAGRRAATDVYKATWRKMREKKGNALRRFVQ